MGIIITSGHIFTLKFSPLKKYFLLLLIITVSFIARAQNNIAPEIKISSKIEKIEGVKYYIHTVEAGQTLYSIAKAYAVNSKDLIFENPELADGINPGQLIKILYKETKKQASPKSEVNSASPFIYHTVEKQQTLYAISKLYGITVDELNKANPELSEGLKIGQQLKIPQSNTKVDLPSESKAVESDKPFIAEIKKAVNQPQSKVLCISLLVPFNSDEIDSVKFAKNTRTAIPSKSYAAIEFYEGILLAIDSLKQLGLNLKLQVFDAPNDSAKIAEVLKQSSIKNSDLIIGPFHNVPAAMVAAYCKKNQILNCIPYAQQNKLLLGNSYAIKVSASSGTQVETIADFIGKHYKKENIVLLHNGLLKEKSSVEVFKEKAKPLLGKDSLVEVIFKTSGAKGLQAKLSTTGNNIIFIPSNDQAFVTSLVNSLRIIKKDYQITLFGMESWISFDNLDINTIQDLQLHIPSSGYVNFSAATCLSMMKKYRSKFKTDPSKYAFQGYDCGLYFLQELMKAPKSFSDQLIAHPYNGLQNNFKFVETAVESGLENRSVFILQYKDFTLSPVK